VIGPSPTHHPGGPTPEDPRVGARGARSGPYRPAPFRRHQPLHGGLEGNDELPAAGERHRRPSQSGGAPAARPVALGPGGGQLREIGVELRDDPIGVGYQTDVGGDPDQNLSVVAEDADAEPKSP
jgi:hypothetical protein